MTDDFKHEHDIKQGMKNKASRNSVTNIFCVIAWMKDKSFLQIFYKCE